jgi:uncharacterized membrane protein YhaH (DUF805 family)
VQLTNAGEIAGFFLARTIVLVLMAVGAPFVLYPIYARLSETGGAVLVTLAGHSMNFVGWLVTLMLFVLLRGGFGGVPTRVAGRRDAVTSSRGEIAAFLISAVIVMIALATVTGYVLIDIYVSLQRSGQVALVVPISLAASAAASVVFFLIFIAVRGAMPGVVSTEGPIDTYDEGGAPMEFGRAIVMCLRKYAVFRGRASRSEFWYFVLFQVLLFIALAVVDASAFHADVLSTLSALILFLPAIAVAVRRLHDADMSGWWVLICFIPLFGLYMLVWMCQTGTKGPNRFGMGPGAIPEVFA